MRAKEFLAERQKLDEWFFIPPAIKALGIAIGNTALWKIFWTSFTVYSVYDLVKAFVEVFEKNQYDLDKMDALAWFEAAAYVALTYVTAKSGIKSAKELISLIPVSVQQKFGAWAKTTFEGKVKEEIAKKAATTAAKPAASTAPKNPNLVDKPFSKDAPVPATPTPGASAFDRMATDLTKTKPKNPNLVDRPFSK
jgi:hypothetical protein